MTALEKEKRYTADEFLALTDLPERCELIDGYIYEMSAAPNTKHQSISKRITGEIDRFIIENHGKCEVFPAPYDVKIDQYNTVQPDILVVCDPEKIDERKCNGAPDWIIEILSPSSGLHDTKDKLILYANAGVKEYWIVDPDDEKVLVYLFGTPNTTGIYNFDDNIPVNIYKDMPQQLCICVSELLTR